MLRSKRDVDRHVEQLEAKIHSESERNLKAFTIAKLYFNVGEYELARKYLGKYLEVRQNSSMALKLNGQVLEALQQRDKALESYQMAFALDRGQKEVVLKICELLVASGSNLDKVKARSWLEEGERHYQRHKTVTDLRKLVLGDDNDSHLNGDDNGNAYSSENSPGDQQHSTANLEDSILWSGGATGFLNGSRRVQSILNTPDRSSTPAGVGNARTPNVDREADVNTPRRFVPRPSPERLAAQVQSVESTQERVVEILLNQNRHFLDEFKNHSYSLLQEMKFHHQGVVDEMKNYRQNVMDLKIEMKQGLHDVKLEVSNLTRILKERGDDNSRISKDLNEVLSALPRRIADSLPQQQHSVSSVTPSPTPPTQQGPRPLALNDLQEALAQQTALLQMSSLGFAAGMFARPPLPPQQQQQQVPSAPMPPVMPTPLQQSQPWGSQPHLPQQQQQLHFAGHPEIALPKTPLPAFDPRKQQPETQHQLPQQNTPPKDKPHEYQIDMPKVVTSASSPFKQQEGPAVPIITTSLLSGVPAPAFSSLSKSPVPSSSQVTQSTVSSSVSSSLFDKFKPKEGSWECGGCMLRQPADQIQCQACESAKPGHEEEVKNLKKKQQEAAKPAFSFGAQGGFKFGGSPAAATATTTTSAATSSPFSGFSFGGGNKQQSTDNTTASFTVTIPSAAVSTSSTAVGATDGHLSFENQSLKLNSEADAKEVADKIVKAKKMTELTFSGNTIGIDAAKAIGVALEKHPEFTRAHWKDMFTGRMKTEIPPALKHLSSGILKANARLVELDLSDNAFGPIGMEGIADLLKSPCCYTLRELKLNNTGCGVTGGKLLAKTLLECYHASKKAGTPLALRIFILGRSRQENDGAKALSEVFKLMGSLEEVIMPQNGIYHEGIAALTDAFANNPNLHTLNLNDNTFTEKGAASLAKVLPKLQKLNYLNIGDCLLRTEGAKLIADALKSGHAELEELHMDSNEIKLEGGEAIVSAVVGKPKMKKLFIGTNCFGEEGCQKLIRQLGDRAEELVGGEIEDDEGDAEEEEEEEEEEDGEDSNQSGEEGEDKNDDDEEEEDTPPVAKPSFSSLAATTTPASPSSIFGGSSSIFGGSANTSSAAATGTSSIFGSSSIFGNSPKAESTTFSIFGGNNTPKTTTESSLFGGKKATDSPASTTPATSLFGNLNKAAADLTKTTESTSLFGNLNKSTEASKGVDFSANKDLPSFGSIGSSSTAASTSGFVFGSKPSSSFSFAGAGSTLFNKGPSAAGQTSPQKEGGEDEHVPDDHDPHFEPIIPLPELITVTTGEEDEEVIFKYRGKVYRYDPDTKQWKERGVGDMKILKHPARNTFRVLLRRDQIHKIACNHLITKDMELKPMFGSENAVCWFAMDYADEEPKMEHLAVRFKLEETKNEFQKKFEECQQQLKAAPATGDAKPASTSAAAATATVTPSPSKDIVDATKDKDKTSENGKDFGASKDLPSFASISSTSGFVFGSKPSSSFSFAGAGSTLFNKAPVVGQASPQKEGGDDEHVPDDHDPHFEPIIPLPELVKVTTGEEDEEVIFKFRGKVYRYDPDTKQWKERGVGDLKILKHPARNTFRVLLRRDQIHKIACNHLITKDMELKPMFGSETAVCWFAMDYADEEPKMEHLAVRFKLEETKNEFQKKFEECQQQLKAAPATGEATTTASSSAPVTSSETTKVPKAAAAASAEDDAEDGEETEGEEEDEENVMYARPCELFELNEDKAVVKSLGQVELRIVYDDDVYGARIVAHLLNGNNEEGEEEEEQACNHLIAMQTSLGEDGERKCSWSALDFSIDPPAYRNFRAEFTSAEDLQEFKDTFYEGKELADQSEILELPQQAGEEQYYYGEGGDYEES